jgi:CheY-like chemotaxis protein
MVIPRLGFTFSKGLQMANILYIEDDPVVQRSASRFLRGHKVEIVGQGTQALILLSEGMPFDVIVSDYDLEGSITGEDVYLWVKSNRPELVNKYIFCSGNDRFEEKCVAAGIRFLKKPCSVTQIRTTINSVLEEKP